MSGSTTGKIVVEVTLKDSEQNIKVTLQNQEIIGHDGVGYSMTYSII